jgi:putative ABC transport system permease protein
MFRHLLKPIWRRKTRNLMLSLEILLAFVVVFAVSAAGVRYYQLYHLPIGFEPADLWSVQMQQPEQGGPKNDPVFYDKLRRSLLDLPEVEKVAFTSFPLYDNSTWRGDLYTPDGGVKATSDFVSGSDEYFDTLQMKLAEGRWFSAADEGAAEKPVVINRRLAKLLFPGKSAIGQLISEGAPDSKDRSMQRVTGVVEDFRNHGEFMPPVNFAIQRFSPLSSPRGVESVVLKVRPGTSRAFESRLSERMKQVRNDWSYRISPVADMRKSLLRNSIIPLVVLAVIGAFLLLMVGFGLFGVLWQSTTQRIPEIGLRRAIGATAADIYGQIVFEQLLLTGLAMAVGLVLLAQLPITGVLGENLSWPLFMVAALLSMLVMSLVSVVCALYPAWRASRLSPTQALHYE